AGEVHARAQDGEALICNVEVATAKRDCPRVGRDLSCALGPPGRQDHRDGEIPRPWDARLLGEVVFAVDVRRGRGDHGPGVIHEIDGEPGQGRVTGGPDAAAVGVKEHGPGDLQPVEEDVALQVGDAGVVGDDL